MEGERSDDAAGPHQQDRRHTWIEQTPQGLRLIPTTRAGRLFLAMVRAVVLGLGLLIVLGVLWLFVDVGGAAEPSDRAALSFRGLLAAVAILTASTFVLQWRALERDHARRLPPRSADPPPRP